MRTRELSALLKKHKDTRNVFKGVYPCDKIPKSLPNYSAIIANTDPSGKPGRHWVAYFFNPTHVYFFDSYGKAPWKKELQQPMTMRKRKKYFGRRLQGSSQVCGQYCIYFILAMIKGWGFKRFGNQLNQNDMLVKKIVAHHFQAYKRTN